MNVSAKADIVSSSTTASRDQDMGPAAALGHSVLAAGYSVHSDIANEFAALTQLNSGLHLLAQAGMSSVSRAPVTQPLATLPLVSKDGTKGGSSDATGSSQHTQPAMSHAGSQAGSQEATSAGDQSQDSGSTQGQSATPAQMNPASHGVAALAPSLNIAIAAMPATAPVFASVGGHAANAPGSATPVPVAVPQALPVINTAKLIQNMGQSEMRVGMRSAEFGNISISTSATRDLISAQISLDHTELAKVLTTHLPEMQARLESNQPVDVRIDLNGEQSRQSSSAFGDPSSGSADASRGGRQQGDNSAPHNSRAEANGQQFSTAAAVSAMDGGSNSRLDLRV
jgi:hypothetical protein